MSTYNPDKSFDEFSNDILNSLKEKQATEGDTLTFHIKGIAAKTILGVLRKYHQTYYQNQSQD